MSITYQEELVQDAYDEIMPLVQAVWDEVDHRKETYKLNPEKEMYIKANRAGHLALYTARENGVPVGFVIVVAAPEPHSRGETRVATDVLYFKPHVRGTEVPAKMFEFIKQEMRKFKVKYFYLTLKAYKDHPKFAEQLGLTPHEVTYRAVI